MANYTIQNLHELEDMALKYGHSSHMEARFATKPLELEKLGLGFQRVKPNQRVPFQHRHKEQEEVFIITAGNGTMILGNESIPVKAWDAIRIPPEVVRTAEAGSGGLEMIVVGAPFTGKNDAEMIKDQG